jgi:hypothetical protein
MNVCAGQAGCLSYECLCRTGRMPILQALSEFMNSFRDVVNVGIAIVLLSFIGLSLFRLTVFFLQSQNLM